MRISNSEFAIVARLTNSVQQSVGAPIEWFDDSEIQSIHEFILEKGVTGTSFITTQLLEEIFNKFADFRDPHTKMPKWTPEMATKVMTQFLRIAEAEIDTEDVLMLVTGEFFTIEDFRSSVKFARPRMWWPNATNGLFLTL